MTLAGLALTPMDFLEGSSRRKRTRGSTRTSVQPSSSAQSPDRSIGLSLPVANTSNDVYLQQLLQCYFFS